MEQKYGQCGACGHGWAERCNAATVAKEALGRERDRAAYMRERRAKKDG